MATPLTLAQLRDAVRRHLQIIPPIDSGGLVGDTPVGQPDPNNNTINQAINRAIAAINRVVRVGKITTLPPMSVSAAPTYLRGPYYVDYSSLVVDPLDTAEVSDALWVDGSGNTYRLEPYTYYSEARKFMQFQQYTQAAHPVQYFMMGNQLGLLPPPNAAGTLYITQMEGLTQLVNDTDTVSFLPVAYHDIVEYLAVAILSARAAQDVEAGERFQKFWMLSVSGLQQIYDWKNGYGQASITAIRDTLSMIPGMEKALQSAIQTAPSPNNQSATG